MLHVQLGEASAAVLRQAGVPGEVVVFADPVIDGPTPAGLPAHDWRTVRAGYLAANSSHKTAQQMYDWLLAQDRAVEHFIDHDEILFWTDACLFDQAIFVDLIDEAVQLRLGETALSLICVGEYPGIPRFTGLCQLSAAQMAQLLPARTRITRREIVLARQAWAALRSPDPTVLQRMAYSDTQALPYLGEALFSRLEQYPSAHNGLSRLAEETLRVVAEGIAPLGMAFMDVDAGMAHPYLSDMAFCRLVEELAGGDEPALTLAGPGPLPHFDDPSPNLGDWTLAITPFGRELLAHDADWLERNGINRWIGGVYLHGARSPWRWDAHRRTLVGGREASS